MTIKYKPGGVKVTIGKSQDVSLPARVFRGRATCMHFDTDKAFLLPPSIPGVRNILLFFQRHPGVTMLINGHTDLIGDAQYNLQLSKERAAAVAAYLLDRVDDWLAWYSSPIASKRWSYGEDQDMLATVLDGAGAPYHGGPKTGVNDAATQDAARRFQTDNGLNASGQLDGDTRRALIAKYMALEGTSLPTGTPLLLHGCGKFHPIDATTQADQGNRRVEIFLFDGAVEPPPQDRCPAPGCTEYLQWVGNPEEDIDLCQAQTFDLDVLVVDRASPPNPIAGAVVTVDVPGVAGQTTDRDGRTVFVGLPDGKVHVVATAGSETGSADAVVGPPAARTQSSFVQQSFAGQQGANGQVTVPVGNDFIVDVDQTSHQAFESSYQWQGDVVHLKVDGKVEHLTQQQAGEYRRGSGAVTRCELIGIGKNGPHRTPISWPVSGLPRRLTPGQAEQVTLQSRLRLSVVDFNASFTRVNRATGRLVGVNTAQLDALKDSGIDDYTLTDTIFFTDFDHKTNQAAPPDWLGFLPQGASSSDPKIRDQLRTLYLTSLIDEMHQRGMQVMVGYKLDPGSGATLTRGNNFVAWLRKPDDGYVARHAQQIVDFFESRAIPIDGIDFDIEIPAFGKHSNHATNFATLVTRTAELFSSLRRDFMVSYDNATFLTTDPDRAASDHFRAQPYSLAQRGTNIVARAMHHLTTPPSPGVTSEVARTVAVALRPLGRQGGGLHPSQLQIMIDYVTTGDDRMKEICNTVLRPNRVGLVMYNFGMRGLDDVVRAGKLFDEALNPAGSGVPRPGTTGQPLQVPRDLVRSHMNNAQRAAEQARQSQQEAQRQQQQADRARREAEAAPDKASAESSAQVARQAAQNARAAADEAGRMAKLARTESDAAEAAKTPDYEDESAFGRANADAAADAADSADASAQIAEVSALQAKAAAQGKR